MTTPGSLFTPTPLGHEYNLGGLGLNPGEDMNVCKCLVPSQQGGTLNSRRAVIPLVRLVVRDVWWEAPDLPGCSPSKLGRSCAKSYCYVWKLDRSPQDELGLLACHKVSNDYAPLFSEEGKRGCKCYSDEYEGQGRALPAALPRVGLPQLEMGVGELIGGQRTTQHAATAAAAAVRDC
ncbi:hypothetical protein TNCV_3037691 [Trichonephila clavipes]|nr:hypothetical protein TNCV_3037691 [Trichonephila clavipes]